MANTITIHNARCIGNARTGTTGSGIEFCQVQIAENPRTGNGNQEGVDVEPTLWHVTQFGAGSVALGAVLVAGAEVIVVGEVVTGVSTNDDEAPARTVILATKIAPVQRHEDAAALLDQLKNGDLPDN